MWLFSKKKTKKKTEKRKIGDRGEDIFVKHIVKHKYKILDRNYLKKWGEIDVIAEKDGILHFFEVKTVTQNPASGAVEHDPEENVHFWKRKRLSRAIESYLSEKNTPEETTWQVDVGAVFLDSSTNQHTIRITEDVDVNG